jgi:hypothetical protein
MEVINTVRDELRKSEEVNSPPKAHTNNTDQALKIIDSVVVLPLKEKIPKETDSDGEPVYRILWHVCIHPSTS